ncbi:MAG: NusG domain II-containing protein [Peptostreptococcus sp.]|uniref:NusG domain II-containing protein n=1 Tax=Peptostreptococcus sp. TaxID=1262 RepID=UPI002FCC9273
MKKKDVILIGVILLAILVSIFANKVINSGDSDRIEIYVKNKLYKEYPIDADEKITIENGNEKNVIYIHDKGVEMLEANCPDEVCIKAGFINKAGQSIVCLPHKINIKIVTDDKTKKDLDVTTK